MGQTDFFDLEDRYAELDKEGKDDLVRLDAVVRWGRFGARLAKAWRVPVGERKSAAVRKPFDEVVMFKVLLLGELYSLSDAALAQAIRERLTFMGFLGLGLGLDGRVPDEKTIWGCRADLTASGKFGALFEEFDKCLCEAGYFAQGGQIVDAALVPVPTRRNMREENARLREGEVPEEWRERPEKLRQKDVDATWTRQNGKRHYGYKNHVSIDRKYKLVRRWEATTAATHETTVMEQVIDGGNRARSKVRARVEHVFGSIRNERGGNLARSIGFDRARAHQDEELGIQHAPPPLPGSRPGRLRMNVSGDESVFGTRNDGKKNDWGLNKQKSGETARRGSPDIPPSIAYAKNPPKTAIYRGDILFQVNPFFPLWLLTSAGFNSR